MVSPVHQMNPNFLIKQDLNAIARIRKDWTCRIYVYFRCFGFRICRSAVYQDEQSASMHHRPGDQNLTFTDRSSAPWKASEGIRFELAAAVYMSWYKWTNALKPSAPRSQIQSPSPIESDFDTKSTFRVLSRGIESNIWLWTCDSARHSIVLSTRDVGLEALFQKPQ